MADFGYDFDPDSIPPSDRNFDPLPPGWYPMQIIESDVVDIAKGNMLKLTFEITDGPHASRKVWGQYCIRHESEQAQSIAQRALADMFLATGTPPSRNSDDLHFKPFQGRLKITRSEGYDPKNEVTAYKPLNGAAPAQKARTEAAKSASAASTTAKTGTAAKSAPWRKSA
jgi:hypothetical protein